MKIIIIILLYAFNCKGETTTEEQDIRDLPLNEIEKVSEEIYDISVPYTDFIIAERAILTSSLPQNIDQDSIKNYISQTDNLQEFFRGNPSQEQMNLLVRELICFSRIYNFPYEHFTGRRYEFFEETMEDNIELSYELASRDFLWNEWPINVYIPEKDNILTIKDHSLEILINDNDLKFPKKYMKDGDDKHKTKKQNLHVQLSIYNNKNEIIKHNLQDAPRELLYTDNVEDYFIEKTKGILARHHILPHGYLIKLYDKLEECLKDENYKNEKKKKEIDNAIYKNNFRALIGNLLDRGLSVESIKDLYDSNNINSYQRSLFLWHPGNLFIGPGVGRFKEPQSNFEKTSEIILGKYMFNKFKKLWGKLEHVKNIQNCDEIYELYRNIMITFIQNNNGQKGLIAIRLNSDHWQYMEFINGIKTDTPWKIRGINNDNVDTFNKISKLNNNRKDDDFDPDKGNYFKSSSVSLTPIVMLCNVFYNRRKRSIYPEHSINPYKYYSLIENRNLYYSLSNELKTNSSRKIFNYIIDQIKSKNLNSSLKSFAENTCELKNYDSNDSKCNINYEFVKCVEYHNRFLDCPRKALVDKLLHHYCDGKSGYNDGIFAILQKEEGSFDLTKEFEVWNYVENTINNSTKVAYKMISNLCGLSKDWPEVVSEMELYVDGKIWRCNTYDIVGFWSKIGDFLNGKCSRVKTGLLRK